MIVTSYNEISYLCYVTFLELSSLLSFSFSLWDFSVLRSGELFVPLASEILGVASLNVILCI